ncbi:hypothetical protein QWY93_12100 [Echinicola jeungdonensis]|uniref:Type IX secretion system membrane protein PorP/SprF n=1 Tax=Echinicola jeungdonensis TaxID=709343 RepID=A0ABV5J478_9BACT|nr:hypothetical protein [Echinicola jeungdonensis]MDN3670066.1 hypothetical protein [Echinicola jeungdonensis]
MEKTTFVFLVFFMALPFIVYGQANREAFAHGARSSGLANSHVTLEDGWSIFNNVGAMGRVKNTQLFCAYDHRLGLRELTTLSAGGIFTNNLGNIGFSISHFGGSLFNQQNIGLGYSNTFGLVSLGLKVNYLQTNLEGYGRSGQPFIEWGGVAQLMPTLMIGAHVFNPTRAKINNKSEDRLPTLIQIGLSYRPSPSLMVNLETQKDILLPPQVKAGLEYNFSGKFWARCGIQPQPSQLFFGIGFKPKSFYLNYATSNHHKLGFTHHFSVNFLLDKN